MAKVSVPQSAEAVKNVILVSPEDIIADAKENTRSVNNDDIKAMMDSILKDGQLQPVKAQSTADGKLKLVYGFTRHAAFKKLNEKTPDQQRKIRVEVVGPQEAKAAYRMSVIENYQRKNPNPIELAQQQQALMDDYGDSEADVAALFGWKGSDGIEKLRQSLKLLNLPKSVQSKVQGRELPVVAAIEMIGLTEPEMTEIIENADRLGTGRIKGESVRKAAREKKAATTGTAVDKVRGRKEIAEFFANLTGPGEDDAVKTLAKKLTEYADGKISEETAAKHFRALGGAIKNPKAPPPAPAPEVATPKPAKAKVAKKAAPKKRTAKATPAGKEVAPATTEAPVEVVEEVTTGEPEPVEIG